MDFQEFRAEVCPYVIIRRKEGCQIKPLPLWRNADGKETMYCVGSHHGRSYVVEKEKNGRYIVSKGNGLSYTQYTHICTGEYGDNTWGMLLREDAIRDFEMGEEIASLGIKTNEMQYVIELEKSVMLTNGHRIKPVLLQYSVECPYRISDAVSLTLSERRECADNWPQINSYGNRHMAAAEILIKNLRTLHDHDILHNAIHAQNYTWALELLDFELACSPKHPYSDRESRNKVKDLFPREIIQTYEIIRMIADSLNEQVDYMLVDDLFAVYGFDLSKYSSEFI